MPELMRCSCAVMSIFCAWVLWTQTFERGLGGLERWAIMEALQTKNDCDGQLRKEIAGIGPPDIQVGSHGVGHTFPDGSSVVSYWYCLSDTVDPRVPTAAK